MSFIESFLVTLTSLFTEFFAALGKVKSNFAHAIGRHSNFPIIRMFHEALKSE